jgi:hypothetical protein
MQTEMQLRIHLMEMVEWIICPMIDRIARPPPQAKARLAIASEECRIFKTGAN